MIVDKLNLEELLPNYYKNVYEMQELNKVEQNIFEQTKVDMQQIQDNASILLCDEPSLRLYESMLRIFADQANETIEFRRMRVINRINMRPPFTLKFLIQKLNEIFGQNNYEVRVDTEEYRLYIESSVDSQNWFNEVNLTVNNIKPSNIEYIQIPLYSERIQMNERGYISRMEYARAGYALAGITPLERRIEEIEVELL